MKLSTLSAILVFNLVLACAVVAAAWQSHPDAPVANACVASVPASSTPEPTAEAATCATTDTDIRQITWSNWLSGKSRSAQFHFLDLFELLFGSSDKKHDYQPF